MLAEQHRIEVTRAEVLASGMVRRKLVERVELSWPLNLTRHDGGIDLAWQNHLLNPVAHICINLAIRAQLAIPGTQALLVEAVRQPQIAAFRTSVEVTPAMVDPKALTGLFAERAGNAIVFAGMINAQASTAIRSQVGMANHGLAFVSEGNMAKRLGQASVQLGINKKIFNSIIELKLFYEL